MSIENLAESNIDKLSELLFLNFENLFLEDGAKAINALEKHVLNCALASNKFLSKIETDRNMALDSFGCDDVSFKKIMINLIESNNPVN